MSRRINRRKSIRKYMVKSKYRELERKYRIVKWITYSMIRKS